MSQVKQNRRKPKSGIGRKNCAFCFDFWFFRFTFALSQRCSRAEIIPNEPEQVMLLREKMTK
jgi:hypothetical protein